MLQMPQIPESNAMVPVGDLIALNKALRKASSGDIGYQTPTDVSGGGNLSALVPQSLEGTLSSATYTMKELVFWPDIAKKSVGQTVHEYNVVNEHGQDLDPFLEEGGAGANNKSTYARKFIKIKYLAERREVTDVATMVGLVGPNSTAIAEETQRGTLRLLQKLERSLFHASSAVNPLAFDGVFKQMDDNAASNSTNLDGGSCSPDLLQAILGEVYSAPNFGRPDKIYVEPRVHTDLIRQAVAYGRHDQMKLTGASGLTFGAQHLNIMAPYGPVPICPAPFLFTGYDPPTAGAGETVAKPVDQTVAVAGSGSLFAAADAGNYFYRIVAVTKDGYSAPQTTLVAAVVAGESITVEWDNAAATTAKWYRIYRTDKDELVGGKYRFVTEIPANDTGAGSRTQFVDGNEIRPKTSKILLAQNDPTIMEFVRLLDFLRRPLAEVATTKPFLLMLFGAPIVKVPTKMWQIKNVGVSDSTVSVG